MGQDLTKELKFLETHKWQDPPMTMKHLEYFIMGKHKTCHQYKIAKDDEKLKTQPIVLK